MITLNVPSQRHVRLLCWNKLKILDWRKQYQASIKVPGRELFSCLCKDLTRVHPFHQHMVSNERLLMLSLSCSFSLHNCFAYFVFCLLSFTCFIAFVINLHISLLFQRHLHKWRIKIMTLFQPLLNNTINTSVGHLIITLSQNDKNLDSSPSLFALARFWSSAPSCKRSKLYISHRPTPPKNSKSCNFSFITTCCNQHL